MINSSIPSIQALEFLKTLYLFGKSDIPAAVLPSMVVSFVLTDPSLYSVSSALTAFLWIAAHLLAFDVKNQMLGIPEDKISKPDRPLPSGRISLQDAGLLYAILFCLMWAISVYTGTEPCTLFYTIAILVYNEGGLARIAMFKNVLGGFGMSCYCWGGASVLGQTQSLNTPKSLAIFIFGAVFATTGHAQDFRDIKADAHMQRRTIPLLLTRAAARWSLAFLIMAWTTGLLLLWCPPRLVAGLFGGVAVSCAGWYLLSRGEEDDYWGYVWYGVSTSFAFFVRVTG
ncbi:UbiA prenyltransferase family [Aspergillus aurantiobrunneus]